MIKNKNAITLIASPENPSGRNQIRFFFVSLFTT